MAGETEKTESVVMKGLDEMFSALCIEKGSTVKIKVWAKTKKGAYRNQGSLGYKSVKSFHVIMSDLICLNLI